MRTVILTVLSLVAATAAQADEREFCADRPGLGTPACTMTPGQVMAELGIAAWSRSSDADAVTDNGTYGDLLVRIGLDDRTELQIGQTAFGTSRRRDLASGAVMRQRGAGDSKIAMRRGLAGPNGPVAVQAFMTLPTGSDGIGAGDWGAGILMPANADLPGGFALAVTPEIDAAVNASGSGRHLAWGGVIGLSHPLGKLINLSGEMAAWRDNDPARHTTSARAAISLAWQAGADWQVDLEGDLGLTGSAPDHSLLIGIAHRL